MKEIRVDANIYAALRRIAEHQGTSADAVAGEKLTRILTIERDEWIAAHSKGDEWIAAHSKDKRPTPDQPMVDMCSEQFLRQICGDNWVPCWWAAGCWLP